jgi:short-subunit dehydrogenase
MHIVVTGASSGIGRELARAFDRPGNRISLVARRENLLAELRGELRAETCAVTADLSDARDPIGWLRRAEEAFGPTDVLINNAGTSYVEPVQGIDEARIRALFQINVHTPIAAIHHVLPAMLSRGRGTIVNVASNAAFSPAPYFCHYTATKGALGNFSESLRMEIKRTGVHVVSVYPGPIRTPMGERNWGQLKPTLAAKIAPEGDARALARLVLKAVERRRARVIYPRFYVLGWWLPGVGRWIAERFVPEATGAVTPPLDGDGARPAG